MTKNDKNDKMKNDKNDKKICPKKNFTKKSIKNYQKLNKKLSGNRQTDRPT